MSDFVTWAEKLATNEYLTLFYGNYLRIKQYGATNSKLDQQFKEIIKTKPDNVSIVPYQSRNSAAYFEEVPNSVTILPDLNICERAAIEYIEVAELCATVDYYMANCQFENSVEFEGKKEFLLLRQRARRVGVSTVPYHTKRSTDYAKNLALLLSPIDQYC